MDLPVRTNTQRFVERAVISGGADVDREDEMERVLSRLFETIRVHLRYADRVDHFSHPTISGWRDAGLKMEPGHSMDFSIRLSFGVGQDRCSGADEIAAVAVVEGAQDD